MFELIQKILSGILGGTVRSIIQSMAPPDPEPIAPQTMEAVRSLCIKTAKEVSPDEWEINLGPGKLYFGRSSWESARNTGNTFLEMLSKVKDETFSVLYWIVSQENVKAVHVSSLWRPWAGVHTLGLGIDIGTIQFTKRKVYIYREGNQKDFKELKALRVALWNSGKINQYIDPWKTNGILGYPPGWRKNGGIAEIDRQHRNHCHLTVRS